MPEIIYLSRAKHDEFVSKLNQLRDVDFPANRIEMKSAMQSGGGMHDNAGYEYAAQREKMILQQIADLEVLLSNSRIIEEHEIDTQFVRIGTKVRVLDLDSSKEMDFIIAGAYETDEDRNLISYLAPIAKGLVGRTTGEVAEIKTPKGILRLKILLIERALNW